MDGNQNRGVDDWSGFAPEGPASSGHPAEVSELLSNNSLLTSETLSDSRMQASRVILNTDENYSMCREDIFLPSCHLPFDTENSELVNLGSLPRAWHPHVPTSADPLALGIQDSRDAPNRKGRKDPQTKLQIQSPDREWNLQYVDNDGLMNDNQHVLGNAYSSGPSPHDWQQYAPPPTDPQAPSNSDGTRRGRKKCKPKSLKVWQWQPQNDENLEARRLRAVKARNQRVAKTTELYKMQKDLNDVQRDSDNLRLEISGCVARIQKLEIVKMNSAGR